MPKVFIGSTRQDLEDYREAALATCLELGLEPIAMEDFPAMGLGATDGSRHKLDEADVYVGIFAFRYGYIEHGHPTSVTEAEFDYAGERGLERLCFLARRDGWPQERIAQENLDRQLAFRDRVERMLIRAEFDSIPEFIARLTQALLSWRDRHSMGEVDAILITDPADIPELPRRPVRRDDVLDDLLPLLREREQVLLQGFGGVGKTVIAAMGTEEYLKSRRGGAAALWLRVGSMEADAIFEAMARAFDATPTMSKESGVRGRARLLNLLLEEHHIKLVVLDDVWNGQALHEILSLLPRRIPVLVTSRQRYPMEFVLNVGAMREDAALELLSTLARKGYKTDRDAKTLCELLGYHAFALEIAGKKLRIDGMSPAELIEEIAEAPQSLRIPLDFAEAGRNSVADLLEVSLYALDEEAREVFLAFGALFAPSATPELLSFYMERDVSKALKTLFERGLAERNPRSKDRAADYRIHDLAYSYAKMQASESERHHALDACLDYLKMYQSGRGVNEGRLRAELDNLLGAAGWAMVADRYEDVRAIADMLYRGPDRDAPEGFLHMRGYANPGATLITLAQEAAEKQGDVPAQAGYWSILGGLHLDLGQMTQAAAACRKARALYRRLRDGHGAAVALARLGMVYRMAGKSHQAVQVLEEALTTLRKVGDQRWVGIVQNNLGSVYRDWRQYETALAYHEEALKISLKLRDAHGEEITLRKLGAVYRLTKRTDEAIETLKRSLEIARRLDDKRGEGATLGNLGVAYRDKGDYASAIEHLEAARKVAREVGDRRGEGITLGNLGSVYRDTGETEKALNIYRQALSVDATLRNKHGKAITLGRIADIYRDLGQLDEAENAVEQALNISRRERNPVGTAINLRRLGEIGRLKGNLSNAAHYLEEALSLRLEMGDEEWAAMDMMKLAQIYAAMDDIARAESQLHRALAVYERLNMTQRINYVARELDKLAEGRQVN